jgi:hypothetical protein
MYTALFRRKSSKWLHAFMVYLIVASMLVPAGITQAKADAAADFVTSVAVSSEKVTPGESVTLTASVRAFVDRTVNIGLEVLDQQGNKVFQASADHQKLKAGAAASFPMEWKTPGDLANGTYTVNLGVFQDN